MCENENRRIVESTPTHMVSPSTNSRTPRKKRTESAKQKRRFFREGNKLPKCVNEGCDKDVIVRDWKYWSFRSECSTCICARRNGKTLEGIVFHKKDYCENIDGGLGFVCPVPKDTWKSNKGFLFCLDLDHLDGDHHNNKVDNIKTFCKLCHARKSFERGDCNSHKGSARKIDRV